MGKIIKTTWKKHEGVVLKQSVHCETVSASIEAKNMYSYGNIAVVQPLYSRYNYDPSDCSLNRKTTLPLSYLNRTYCALQNQRPVLRLLSGTWCHVVFLSSRESRYTSLPTRKGFRLPKRFSNRAKQSSKNFLAPKFSTLLKHKFVGISNYRWRGAIALFFTYCLTSQQVYISRLQVMDRQFLISALAKGLGWEFFRITPILWQLRRKSMTFPFKAHSFIYVASLWLGRFYLTSNLCGYWLATKEALILQCTVGLGLRLGLGLALVYT